MKLLPILALALIPMTPGCIAVVAAGAAVGYTQYEDNEGWQDYEGSRDRVFLATKESLSELG